MATRNVVLPSQLDSFVEERVRSGAYQNASEVVRAGLRLLKAEEEDHAAKLERLKAAIQVGLDDLDNGRFETIDFEDLDEWMDKRGSRDKPA